MPRVIGIGMLEVGIACEKQVTVTEAHLIADALADAEGLQLKTEIRFPLFRMDQADVTQRGRLADLVVDAPVEGQRRLVVLGKRLIVFAPIPGEHADLPERIGLDFDVVHLPG